MGDDSPSLWFRCAVLPGMVHLGSIDPRPVYGSGQGYQRARGAPNRLRRAVCLSAHGVAVTGTRARDRRREPWLGLGCESATKGCGHTSGSADGTPAQSPWGAPRCRDPMRVDGLVPPCAGTTHEPVVGRNAGTTRPAAGPVAARRDEPDTGAPRCPWPSSTAKGSTSLPCSSTTASLRPARASSRSRVSAWTRRAPDSNAATCDWLTPASAASSRWLRSASRRARARYRPGPKGSRAAPRPPLRSITPPPVALHHALPLRSITPSRCAPSRPSPVPRSPHSSRRPPSAPHVAPPP